MLETGEFERVGSSKTRRVDVRVIAATNADLGAEVAAGRFREDLLFRLNTVEIHLPPLRERREDIPRWRSTSCAATRQRYRKAVGGFEPKALQALLAHSWPGNVRELDHAVERAVLMAQGHRARRGDLVLSAGGGPAASLEEMTSRRSSDADQEGAGALRRQRQPGGQGAGAQPERALPAPGSRPAGHETRVFRVALGGGLPAVVLACWLLWSGNHPLRVKLTFGLLVVGIWLIGALLVRERVVRPLQTISNLLAALREGDYSIRARGASTGDGLGLALLEVNALSETLRSQRLRALEATALLRRVIEEMDAAVFAFDSDNRLRLVNRGGERLLGQPVERLLGLDAASVGLAACLAGEWPRTLEPEMTFGGRTGRYGVRRSTFRQGGRPHSLLVLADLSPGAARRRALGVAATHPRPGPRDQQLARAHQVDCRQPRQSRRAARPLTGNRI